ncbi:MAG TPA: VWA domain-containing protein [Terriglobales bacterium]|nr:VWA domain-containing protein [Terriglobales bacterium]
MTQRLWHVFFIGLTLVQSPSRAVSQSINDVHVSPQVQRQLPKTPDDSLAIHMKPLRVNINLVTVPVMVTDAKGSPVTDLGKKDFQLLEDSNVQPIDYFYSEDSPISVGLVVDLSSSMGNKIDRVREAVSEFFKNADPKDDYFVITFADKAKLFANTTQSTETIETQLQELKPKGNTALADAIFLGLDKLKSASYRRRALVIISDGGDNMSRHSLRSVKNLAKESDAQIYAVDVCDAPSLLFTKKLEEKFGRQWLTQVTEVTGGRTIAVDGAEEIPGAASQISRELRNQYVLGYRPASMPHESRWRKIKVRITRKPEPLPFQLYYRTGYMARREDSE